MPQVTAMGVQAPLGHVLAYMMSMHCGRACRRHRSSARPAEFQGTVVRGVDHVCGVTGVPPVRIRVPGPASVVGYRLCLDRAQSGWERGGWTSRSSDRWKSATGAGPTETDTFIFPK